MGKKHRKGKKSRATPSPAARPPSGPSMRAYEAAIATPSRRHLMGADGSQDAEAQHAQEKIRHWGRYLDENHDLAVGVLDELVKNIVGSGIQTIPKPLLANGEVDEPLALAIMPEWKRWTRQADVTGELTWHEAQRVIVRAWMRDGEEFVQHVSGRARGYRFAADQVPYRIELLESQMVPVELEGNGWRQGIRHNTWKQPTSYAIYREQPNDVGFAGTFVSQDDLKIVPAEQLTHLKIAKRWPATRGVSVFSSVISRLYDIKDLEESERIKNRVLASWCAAITKTPDIPGLEPGIVDGGTQYEGIAHRVLEMAGGTVIDSLAPGEEIVGVGPDYPVESMPDHIADQIRRISSGTGTRYSSIARRYDGTYSAQRQEMVESEGLYQMREDVFIARVCREVYERWLIAAAMDGQIRLPSGRDMDLVANAEYRGPATPWIDPKKEVEADALAVAAGFITREQVQIKRGMDADRIGKPIEDAPPREPAQLSLIEQEDDDAAEEAA